MNQFRLVILDYPLKQLENKSVQSCLSDIIFMKQKNFQRTDSDYVVLDKHDMIGTHCLIYETSSFYQPKLVFALRVTYEDRSILHKIKTPVQDLVPLLSDNAQHQFSIFKKNHPSIADCNSWCVDNDFSLKKSGLRLSDIGYSMIFLQVSRMGYDHIIGCTNEKYKASRWLENIGYFQPDFDFIHPVVKDVHKFIMLEKFNVQYIYKVYLENKDLFDKLYELTPEKSDYLPMDVFLHELSNQKSANGNNDIETNFMEWLRINKYKAA